MRYRTAAICSAAVIAAMYGFTAVMFKLVERWATQGIEFTAFKRVLFGVAVLWTTFWWLAIPVIVGFFLVIAVLTSIVRHFTKSRNASASAASAGQ